MNNDHLKRKASLKRKREREASRNWFFPDFFMFSGTVWLSGVSKTQIHSPMQCFCWNHPVKSFKTDFSCSSSCFSNMAPVCGGKLF